MDSIVAKNGYKNLKVDDRYKIDALLKEVRVLKGLKRDAAPGIQEELHKEIGELVGEINRILTQPSGEGF
jgi:hypothetical protein